MNKFYFGISILLSHFLNAQVAFDPGYYITKDGEKIEGFIHLDSQLESFFLNLQKIVSNKDF